MRTADRLSYSEVVGAMLGADALLHVEEGDYATYRHIYLMPPLTEARIPMMRPAGMSSSDQARARAADAPSTSRAGTSRGGSRPVPPVPSVHPHPGWPDMPTELMAWQYGASFPTPIPLEPPMPSDRYTIDPDSPPPSRGYMEEVVGLVATLEGACSGIGAPARRRDLFVKPTPVFCCLQRLAMLDRIEGVDKKV
ncbi:uncharacterized protein LOC114316762 [Camellia sinensis]|uniref:uncharacterized protein LOC114316762 n=1 Tax=Camellia sinensis TaxID=4442 RepID=UPI001036B47C|nr:uncharacterized protein LOC114316762 [Camellia sinensis]